MVSHLQDAKTFTATRILFFPLEDLINYAAGMSKLSFLTYFCISAIVIAGTSLIPLFF
ncbi:MAG: hypothetical protein H6765_05505 [Candidatus Peribacteria bacterium]|nr:MAG: hypothetical protein H6765_05505 [Candidatus Peribacteria bacterium]